MIHEAECHIVLESGTGLFNLKSAAEPPIYTDVQIEEVFPNWRLKIKVFIGRCCQQENRDINNLTAEDFFRYGMKFMISESAKLL